MKETLNENKKQEYRKTHCWFCKSEQEMIWNCDYDYEDFGLEGDGVVAILTCPNCNTVAHFYSPVEEK